MRHGGERVRIIIIRWRSLSFISINKYSKLQVHLFVPVRVSSSQAVSYGGVGGGVGEADAEDECQPID